MTQATNTFATLLRQYREAREISKADLARALGVSPGYMYQLETGRTTAPQLDRVRELAEALRLTPGEEAALLEAAAQERTGSEEAAVLRSTGPQQVLHDDDATPAAGFRLPRPDSVLTISDCVAYRVQTNSMAPRLLEGQLALCSRTRGPNPGDVVMVRLQDGRRHFRNYYPQEGSEQIMLTSNHDIANHPPLTVRPDDIDDLAVVVGIWFG